MDIWMTWCRRVAKCQHCEESMRAGEYMVKGKMWINKGVKLRFTKTYYWHPECWVAQGKAKMDRDGYHSRRSLPLSEEHMRARKLLTVRWAVAKQRLGKAIDKGDWSAIMRISEAMRRIREEIAEVGGIPKKWLWQS